jgi:hypothetical protein
LEQLLDAQTDTFKKLIDKPPRNSTHRATLGTGMWCHSNTAPGKGGGC